MPGPMEEIVTTTPVTPATAPAPTAPADRVDAAGVTLRGVSRSFGGRRVLAPLDLDLAAGSTVALVGASGCGKSTLLRLIAGLDTPTTGTVEVAGQPVRGVHPRTAVVFQEPRLLPWRDLAGNVAFGLPRGTDRAAGRAEVLRWLEVVGLEEFADHRPRRVSGAWPSARPWRAPSSVGPGCSCSTSRSRRSTR